MITTKRRASTHKFYRDLFDNHLRNRVGDVRLRDFQTVNAQRVLDDINLSHASLQRIKTGMSALFSHALRLGYISGHNPVHEAQPEGKRSDFEGVAYTAADVEHMLGKLTGLPRVVVAGAAFTGLRLAELRGLQWSDYDGRNLHVRRRCGAGTWGKPRRGKARAVCQ
jgi:integrase